MTSVLVTGATGFLGSRVARLLAARGDAVRVTARATSSLRRLSGVPVEVVEADVTDRLSLRRAVQGVDAVVHAAGYLEFGPRDPSFMWAVNVDGTANILREASAAGVTAVAVSSVAAYGGTGSGVGDEDWWAVEPSDVAYEKSKREGHLVAREFARDGGVTIVAPGGIYGYGDVSDFDSLMRTFAYFPVPVSYLPDVRQSFVHVDDCAAGIVRLLDGQAPASEYVLCADISSPDTVIALTAEAAGRKPPRFALKAPTIARWMGVADGIGGALGLNAGQVREIAAIATKDLAFSGERARRDLGWAPRPLEQGIAEYVHDLLMEREALRAVGLGPIV